MIYSARSPVGHSHSSSLRNCAVPAYFAIPFAIVLATQGAAAAAQSWPFPTTLSNTAPLAFGMNEEQAAAALGTPLTYVAGRPGNEVYVTIRNTRGGFFPHHDRLYLQFRHGHLSGWKGNWRQRWIAR